MDRLKIIFREDFDLAVKRAYNVGFAQARKEYEDILARKNQELQAAARELRELKARYGLT